MADHPGAAMSRRTATLAALRQIPSAAWICMLVACLNAACWSFITPPFQVPDEPAHFAYAQQLAETGQLPTSSEDQYSPEETTALRDLRQEHVHHEPKNLSISSLAEQHRLQHDLAAPLSREDQGDAGVAASEPPLYYALETIPYGLGSGGTLLDRLELMRLLSALMAGLTALFTFLFVREALPGVRWAWTVGGLGVAFAPLLAFMSGAVNPDAMLYAISAALFYCLARAFRRGLTLKSACTIGTVIAVGFLTKLNFIGLVPGAILGLVFLAREAARTSGRAAYRWLTLALALGAAPAVLYVLVNAISNHPTLGLVSTAIDLTGHHGSIFGEISYIWQFYLPHLPGMDHDFPGIFTTREIWFNGYVGLYGWYDTPFPAWVYDAALLPAMLIVLLCARTLVTSRTALRDRLRELIVYIAIGAGVMVLVGADSYLDFPKIAAEYGAARYLLPMLPLLGAVLALAARGAGRRWGPAVGTLIMVLLLAHDIFSQLLVVSRYYG
jgi:4-amino-4-deoxy-L-arabinose transferase-like glycosyltransferase